MPLVIPALTTAQLKVLAKNIQAEAPKGLGAPHVSLHVAQEFTARILGHADFHAAQRYTSPPSAASMPTDPLTDLRDALHRLLGAQDWQWVWHDMPVDLDFVLSPDHLLPLLVQMTDPDLMEATRRGNGQPLATFEVDPSAGECQVRITLNPTVQPLDFAASVLRVLAMDSVFNGGVVELDEAFAQHQQTFGLARATRKKRRKV